MRKRFFASGGWPIITGLVVGVLAPVAVKFGNPGNMGICVACFTRDIAGALGLHRAGLVQYLRPEIMGILLGALVAAISFREFKPRMGSAPLVRFLLGAFAMIGALVFLGCPWRAYLRLSGGDWNAIYGIWGLVVGIGAGIRFLRRGFSLGRSWPAPRALDWIMPALTVGALRDLILFRGFHLFNGIVALVNRWCEEEQAAAPSLRNSLVSCRTSSRAALQTGWAWRGSARGCASCWKEEWPPFVPTSWNSEKPWWQGWRTFPAW